MIGVLIQKMLTFLICSCVPLVSLPSNPFLDPAVWKSIFANGKSLRPRFWCRLRRPNTRDARMFKPCVVPASGTPQESERYKHCITQTEPAFAFSNYPYLKNLWFSIHWEAEHPCLKTLHRRTHMLKVSWERSWRMQRPYMDMSCLNQTCTLFVQQKLN